MQYLVSVIFSERDVLADAEEEAAIDAFNERLRAEGHWVFAGGLTGPGDATVIDNRNGAARFSDGPFVESKEFLAGFWVIEAPDHETALALAAEGSKACNRRTELRPFH
ncbi:YciI family protein [Actinocorallia longicatena]|uniref:YciI family protein n=1 Tax=Actinocorallia longicatena TaxID=111803 RepID=A0ABP6QCQ5_9ACTN